MSTANYRRPSFVRTGNLVLVILLGFSVWLGRECYDKRHRQQIVRDKLLAIPGVTSAEVSDLNQQASDLIIAKVSLADGGRITFVGVNRFSFWGAGSLRLAKIDGLMLRVRYKDDKKEIAAPFLEIGENSPVLSIRKYEIDDIQSAIRMRSKISEIVSTFPNVSGEWPDFSSKYEMGERNGKPVFVGVAGTRVRSQE